MTREIDRRRVRDYDDIIHYKSLLQETLYYCGLPRDSNHGVFKDEATTCLWCVAERRG